MAKYKAVKDPKYEYVYAIHTLRTLLWWSWWSKIPGWSFGWSNLYTTSLEDTMITEINYMRNLIKPPKPHESKVVEL